MPLRDLDLSQFNLASKTFRKLAVTNNVTAPLIFANKRFR